LWSWWFYLYDSKDPGRLPAVLIPAVTTSDPLLQTRSPAPPRAGFFIANWFAAKQQELTS